MRHLFIHAAALIVSGRCDPDIRCDGLAMRPAVAMDPVTAKAIDGSERGRAAMRSPLPLADLS